MSNRGIDKVILGSVLTWRDIGSHISVTGKLLIAMD